MILKVMQGISGSPTSNCGSSTADGDGSAQALISKVNLHGKMVGDLRKSQHIRQLYRGVIKVVKMVMTVVLLCLP